MALPPAVEELKRKVIADGIERMKRAFDDTPKEYQHFITKIENSKKIKVGTVTEYVSIETPYMAVDGRVKWFTDDHEKQGKKYQKEVSFHTLSYKETVLPYCHVRYVSDIHGISDGVAKVPVGGSGAEGTNPIEVAETSAVGRALGFYGYGVFGSGIASAEEVEHAIAERDRAGEQDRTRSVPAPEPAKTGAEPPAEPAKTSEPQKNGEKPPDQISSGKVAIIHKLKGELRWTDEEYRKFLADNYGGKTSSLQLTNIEGAQLITLMQEIKR